MKKSKKILTALCTIALVGMITFRNRCTSIVLNK